MGARRRPLLVGLPVLVGTAIGAVILVTHHDDRPQPVRGRIVFAAWTFDELRSSTGYLDRPRIVSVAPDGSGGRRVIADATAPAVSADGRVIAYRDGDGVVVEATDGSSRRRVVRKTLDDVTGPAISPDGRTVVVARNHLAQRPAGTVELVGADGQGRRTIGRAPRGTRLADPAWSPDGRTIVFSAYRPDDGRGQLVLFDPRGGRAGRTIPGLARRFAFTGDADIAPDGRTVVFVGVTRDGRSGLYVVRPDGRGLRRLLVVSRGTFGSPAFSPDGRTIVATRFLARARDLGVRLRSGYRIVAVDRASGATRTLRRAGSGTAEDFAWR
ncbi:PD40 domain-containing protein [Patulibacter minatonensis]|uniref:PD40 domain-containing protein n=1 Tax=Patulibacter minatonensis TaxID=298163 RepID=UPI00047E0E64|nr:PD40 domain-containing protein [Patulibacter minatonensis]